MSKVRAGGGSSGTPGSRFPGRRARLCPHPRPVRQPGTAPRLGSWATQSAPLWGHTEATEGNRGLLPSPAPARPPAALWAAGRAPPPGPLVSAGPRHQPPRPAGEQSNDPEPHFHQRAGSGCARGRPTVRMRLSAAPASFGTAVGPEPLEGAGIGAGLAAP